MKKATLYSTVRDFINQVGKGNEFTTTEYIDSVKHMVNVTPWCRANGNPYYRARYYLTLIKSAGVLSHPERGLYVVEALIPENVTLSDFQVAAGYKTQHVWDPVTRTSKVYNVKNNPYNFKADPDTVIKRTTEVDDVIKAVSGKIKRGDTVESKDRRSTYLESWIVTGKL